MFKRIRRKKKRVFKDRGRVKDSRTSKSSNHTDTLKFLFRLIWPKSWSPLKWRVLLALVFLAAAKLLNVFVPFLLKEAVDTISVEPSKVILPVGMIVGYGVFKVLVAVFGELRDLAFVKVSQNAQRVLALKTFKHLHSLSLEFHLSRETGRLSRIIERGTSGLENVFHYLTFNIAPTLLELFLVTAILFYNFSLLYASVVALTIIIYSVLTFVVTEGRLKYRQEMNDAEAVAHSKSIDSLINFETVKYFGNEAYEYDQFEKSLDVYNKVAVQYQKTAALLNIVQANVVGLGFIVVLLLGGRDVVRGTHSIGDFVLLNAFLIQLYTPLNFLGYVYREIKDGLVDLEKMFELLNTQPSVVDDSKLLDFQVSDGKVEFRNVSFSYKGHKNILNDISFTIEPGKTIAIVGPSGSGKSTLTRLLYRFYELTSGSIFTDEQDISVIKQQSLRGAIGVVPQEPVLFNNSIGYNICYGQLGASDEAIREAARKARILDFVESLPNGFNTEVGERGLRLSGGEKQRIAIARTLLSQPKVLIFDEATSAMDTKNESEIQKAIRNISDQHSILMIAHRLSTVIDADDIIVLKDGVIAERGTHRDLLKFRGEYFSLWEKQQSERGGYAN